jgi:heat shock protein HslJ
MKILYVAALMFLLASCGVTDSLNIIWVNSYLVDCAGVAPMKCMLVQKGETPDEGQWQNFYGKIEGFDFEPGYIYQLKVQEEQLENVPADASSVKYTLVEVVEKKEDAKWALHGSWQAVKLNGSVIKLTRERGSGVIPELHIDLEKMQISGMDNCNNFSGQIKKLGENHIEWGPLAVTNKMCPDMTIADAFNQALQVAETYRLNESTLTFMDKEGNEVLEFTRLPDAKVLLNDIWVAETVDGETVVDKANAPRFEINTTTMETFGSDGCNNIKGKLTTLTNTDLVFGPLAGTRKLCQDMIIPNKFNEVIPQVRRYKIYNLRLTLLDEEGNTLVVMRKID